MRLYYQVSNLNQLAVTFFEYIHTFKLHGLGEMCVVSFLVSPLLLEMVVLFRVAEG